MPKIQQNKSYTPKSTQRIYGDWELQEFDKELLEKYTKIGVLTNGDEVKLIDFIQYHKDHGSLSSTGAVKIQVDDFNEPYQPLIFTVIEEKIAQWSKWKQRKEFSTKKTLEELDKLKDKMSIT